MNRTTLMATHTYTHRFLISQLNTNAGMVPELQRENEELKARNRDLQLEIDELKARVRRERPRHSLELADRDLTMMDRYIDTVCSWHHWDRPSAGRWFADILLQR